MRIKVILAVVTVLMAACASHAAEAIGRIIALEGTASVVSADGQKRMLELKSPIYLNDRIATGDGSKIQVSFNDDSVISQGEKSEMLVDEYVFSATKKDDNSCSIKMIKGMFRVITGKITKINPERFRVRTKMATIGIRGCDVGFVITEKSANVFVIQLSGRESITVVARDRVGGGEWDGLIAGKWEDPEVAKQHLVNVTKPNRIVSVTQGAGTPTERVLTPTELSKLIIAVTPDHGSDGQNPPVGGTPVGTGTDPGSTPGGTGPSPGNGNDSTPNPNPNPTPDPVPVDPVPVGPLPLGPTPVDPGPPAPPPPPPPPPVTPLEPPSTTPSAPTPAPSNPTPEPTPTPTPPAPTPVTTYTELGASAVGDWSWGKWETDGLLDTVDIKTRSNILSPVDCAAILAGATTYNLSGIGTAGAVLQEGGTKVLVQGGCNLFVTMGGPALPNWNGTFNMQNGANNSLNFSTYGTIGADGSLQVDLLNNLQSFNMQVNGNTPHNTTTISSGGSWGFNALLHGPPGAVKPTGASGTFNFHPSGGASAAGAFGTDLN